MEIGLELLLSKTRLADAWGNCTLLCNQASVSKNFKHSIPLLREVLGPRLLSLLSPQHGLTATVQDNMIETQHDRHQGTGLPIYSLYSETREPTELMLKGIDTIIVDLQIVGCRVYTFKATIRACREAAKKYRKRVLVLDRPNPLGGTYVEGRSLNEGCRSFVGPDEMPMRHGLTVGECARFFNRDIGAELDLIPMQGWKAWEYWGKSRRPWVLTSPNLATWDAVALYPGLVMLEGTNISEGRGTALPFQLIGAPYIKDSEHLVRRIQDFGKTVSAGTNLRPTTFMPSYGKWRGEVCNGFQIHVMDHELVKSYALCLAIIRAFMDEGGESFEWRAPPYEYEYVRKPMAMITGSEDFERYFEKFNLSDPFWSQGIEDFLKKSAPFLVYERERFQPNRWET